MFVPFVGSLAAAKATVDKKARIMICHTAAQNFEDFVLRIGISRLPFTSTALLCAVKFSLPYWRVRWNGKQAGYQTDDHSYFRNQTP